MNATIRVLIVDDHQMFRQGIRSRLEEEPDIKVVGETGTAEEAVALVDKTSPMAAVSTGAGRRQTWELTVREIEILETLYQGLRNAGIAGRLAISPRTVEAHVGNIIAKLGARSRTEAVRIGLEKKIVR